MPCLSNGSQWSVAVGIPFGTLAEWKEERRKRKKDTETIFKMSLLV